MFGFSMGAAAAAMVILAVILIIVIVYVITGYNSFVKLRNRIDEAFATMDVYLKKRYDLIPNLVSTVKGYAAHEQETLESVVAARNAAQGAQTVEDRVKNENMLTGTLRSLFAVAEAYPELKANEGFLDLQKQLHSVENDVANARKYYNAVVREYNTKTETFPGNLLAGCFHFEKRSMFELENESERQNVQVEF